MPLPLMRSVVPGWVPAGTRSLPLPSSVGTSTSAPSAACVKARGTLQMTSSPARRKNGCGATRISSSRSPAALSGLRAVARAGHDARGAVLDARRDRHLDRVLVRDEAAALAALARVDDDGAATLAALAGALDGDRKDALLEADATAAVARAARVGGVARRGARAAAVDARDDARSSASTSWCRTRPPRT